MRLYRKGGSLPVESSQASVDLGVAFDSDVDDRFRPLRSMRPPNTWSRVANRVGSQRRNATDAQMVNRNARSLPRSKGVHLVSPPRARAVVVDRFRDFVPSERRLISTVTALVFAVFSTLALGLVLSQVKDPAATVTEGVNPNFEADSDPSAPLSSPDGNSFSGGLSGDLVKDGIDGGSPERPSDTVVGMVVVGESTKNEDATDGEPDNSDSQHGDSQHSDSQYSDSQQTDSDSKGLPLQDVEQKMTTTTSAFTTVSTQEPTTTVEEETINDKATTTAPQTTEPKQSTTVPDIPTVPTTSTIPTTSTSAPTVDDSVVTLRGVLSESFTDCVSHLVLDSSGNAVPKGQPISCDGGSWIIVNGTRIRTSGGFAVGGSNKHKDIQPGTTVVVKAAPDQFGNLSLACGECSFEAQGGEPPASERVEGVPEELNCQSVGLGDVEDEAETLATSRPNSPAAPSSALRDCELVALPQPDRLGE